MQELGRRHEQPKYGQATYEARPGVFSAPDQRQGVIRLSEARIAEIQRMVLAE